MSGKKIYGPPRTDFGPSPPGYVAGSIRNATGFSTRLDIGSAGKANFKERGVCYQDANRLRNEEERSNIQNSVKGALFNNSYSNEDRAADAAYLEVDKRMDERRKRKQMDDINRTDEEIKLIKIRENIGEVVPDFKKLKTGLSTVTEEEWMDIPDAVDLTRREKSDFTRYTAVPDSVLGSGGVKTVLDGVSSHVVNVDDIGSVAKAKEHLLEMNLEKVMKTNVTGVNAQEYLSSSVASATSSTSTSTHMTGDYKRLKATFRQLMISNPNYSLGWLGAIRLERDHQNYKQARVLVDKAVVSCADDVEVWEEAVDIYHSTNFADVTNKEQVVKKLIVQALEHHPSSERVWKLALRVETNTKRRVQLAEKALDILPDSVDLWTLAVEGADDEDAVRLLRKAVVAMPKEIRFWLALAQLEDYNEAKKVLNRARQHVGDNMEVWVHACLLEESRIVDGKEKEKEEKMREREQTLLNQTKLGNIKTEDHMHDDDPFSHGNHGSGGNHNEGNSGSSGSGSGSGRDGRSEANHPSSKFFYDYYVDEDYVDPTNALSVYSSIGLLRRIFTTGVKTMLKAAAEAEDASSIVPFPSRAEWLEKARHLEAHGHLYTATAVLSTTAMLGLAKFDYHKVKDSVLSPGMMLPGVNVDVSQLGELSLITIKNTLKADVEACEAAEAGFCAKVLLLLLCEMFQDDEDIWLLYVNLLCRQQALHFTSPDHLRRKQWIEYYSSNHNDDEDCNGVYAALGLPLPPVPPSRWPEIHPNYNAELRMLLERALDHNKSSEVLWLHLAKQTSISSSLVSTRKVLAHAFNVCSNSVDIWLAAAKNEVENGFLLRGINLLKDSLKATSNGRVAVKLTKLLRVAGEWHDLESLLLSMVGAKWSHDGREVVGFLKNSSVSDDLPCRDVFLQQQFTLSCDSKLNKYKLNSKTLGKLWMMLIQLYLLQYFSLTNTPLPSSLLPPRSPLAPLAPMSTSTSTSISSSSTSFTTQTSVSSNCKSCLSTDMPLITDIDHYLNRLPPHSTSSSPAHLAFVSLLRKVLRSATLSAPSVATLWQSYAFCEASPVFNHNYARARALIDSAKSEPSLSGNVDVWLTGIELERRGGMNNIVAQQLAKALQTCTTTTNTATSGTSRDAIAAKGLVYSYYLKHDVKPVRRGRAHEALTSCSTQTNVLTAVAKMFWGDGKYSKARTWFNKAVCVGSDSDSEDDSITKGQDEGEVNPNSITKRGDGDVWVWYLKFELEMLDKAKSTLTNCIEQVTLARETAAHLSNPLTVHADPVSVSDDERVVESRKHVTIQEKRIETLVRLCVAARPQYGSIWTVFHKLDCVVTPKNDICVYSSQISDLEEVSVKVWGVEQVLFNAVNSEYCQDLYGKPVQL